MADLTELRDPSGATIPLRFTSPGQPQIADWDARQAVHHGLYGSTWVYRCAWAVATALASLPFRAGPDPTDRTNYNPDARLAQLLGPPPGGPAPKITAHRLLAHSVVQLLITGRFGIEVEASGQNGQGDVVALWPLISAQLRPVPTQGGTQLFSAFKYGQEYNEKTLAPDQVIYHWRMGALDIREPESVLKAARYDVSIETALNRYQFGFIKNDARPAGLVITPEFAETDAFEAFKRQWANQFTGPDNAGKLAFMEVDGDDQGGVSGAVDVKILGLSQNDAQMLETHDAKIKALCAAFGVPKTVLGIAEGNTFANAAEEYRVFWINTVLPLAEELADVINLELAPRVGTELGWFDHSHIEVLQTKHDPVTQTADAPTLVETRLMTINEARADYGLGPLPDGDRLMTADEINALRPSAPPAYRSLGRAGPVLPTQDREARVAVDSSERRARVWKTADASWRGFESLWERQLRRLFERQRTSTIKRLRGKTRARKLTAGSLEESRDASADVFDPAHWQAESEADLRALYEAVTNGALTRLTDQLGVSFDLEAKFVEAFITGRANQLAEQVTATTYRQITEQMAEGVAAGESIDDLAARVEAVFDQATTNRATVIARTEVISASNGAAMTAVGTLGPDVVAAAEWIAARDSRVRESHSSADGQVVPIGQPFTVGGATLAYPGDPAGPAAETIRCRCAVAFLTPEEVQA